MSTAARILGVAQPRVTVLARTRGWDVLKDGRSKMVLLADVEAERRQRHKNGASGPTILGEDALTVGQFAALVGVAERTVHEWRTLGKISEVTHSEARRVLAERTEEADETGDDDTDEDAGDDPAGMSFAAIRRRKEYWLMRHNRTKALAAEGKLYDASEVEARVRRMAELVKVRVEQVPRALPTALDGKTPDEMRAVLARWSETFLGELATEIERSDA